MRKEGLLGWLRPDGKSQVTVVYEDGTPVAVDTVVLLSLIHIYSRLYRAISSCSVGKS